MIARAVFIFSAVFLAGFGIGLQDIYLSIGGLIPALMLIAYEIKEK